MQTKATYTNATWDFVVETVNGINDIWKMNSCTNNGYPVFSWQALNPASESYNSISTCSSVTINGNTYNSSQIVIDTLVGQAASGCDSIVTTYLYILIPITQFTEV
ncbi:MAG: hypothetical protein IPG89_06705 [Bacteroidetes bacterium]|nr:hypothetical protein [Bacteroidota bacterium]